MSYISSIRLKNFRNLDDQDIQLTSSANILIGSNGAGKTNVLESVSLLSPGRGIKKQLLSKITKNQSKEPWTIFIKYIKKDNSELEIALTYEEKNDSSNIKKILIDGNRQKKLSELEYIPPIIWFIPEIERLFIGSPSIRRDFIDRITYSFEKKILSEINSYNKLLKERQKILKFNNYDNDWISKIEKKIAQLGIEIIIKRNNTINLINEMYDKIYSKIKINRCFIEIIGEIDKFVINNKRDISEKKYINELSKSREDDKIRGGCKIGPHKSDIKFIYLKENIEASFCSTGQQKEIILNTLLCQVYCLIVLFKKKPIILLDEICSHLDHNIRSILLHFIEWLEIQVLMTGTDDKLFSFLEKKARFFSVKNGNVESKLD